MAFQCVLFTARAFFIAPHRVTCIQHLHAVLPLLKRYVGIIQNPTVLNQFKCMSLTSQGRHCVTLLPGQLVRSFHSAVVRDVVLFEHDRTRFFRLLALFCGGQFLFWSYLAYFAFTGLRDTRKSSKEPQKVRTELGLFSFDMNLGSNTWRFGFTLGCLIIGKCSANHFQEAICILSKKKKSCFFAYQNVLHEEWRFYEDKSNAEFYQNRKHLA